MEQLAIQRRQAASQGSSSSASGLTMSTATAKASCKMSAPVLGNYQYDPERKAYFPVTSSCFDKHVQGDGKVHDNRASMLLLDDAGGRYRGTEHMKSSCQIFAASQVSTSSNYRAALQQLSWECILSKRVQLVRNTFYKDCKDFTRIAPINPIISYDDCAAKMTTLHPSSRTFDILPSNDEKRSPHILSTVGTLANWASYRSPTSCSRFSDETVFENSIFRSVPILFEDATITSVRFCPFNYSDDDCHFALLENKTHRGSYVNFFKANNVVDSKTTFLLGQNHNDICFISEDKMASGGDRRFGGFHFFDLEYSATIYKRSFASSDILCIETNHFNAGALVGCRNGTVFMEDFRSKNSLQVAREKSGNITTISSLWKEPHELLFRTSSGICYLYDIRCLTSQIRTAKSRIFEMKHPSSNVSKTGFSCGLSVIPNRNLVLAPIISSENKCGISMWSLRQGTFISSYYFATEQMQRSGNKFVEICPTVTHPITTEQFKEAQRLSSVGVWFKTNCWLSDENTALRAGGINLFVVP